MNRILSCDWGTTSFRLRLIDVDTVKVLQEIKTFDGINAMNNEWLATKKNEELRLNFYRSFIETQVEKMDVDVTDVALIISGMASSTIGMKELPYAKLPLKIEANGFLTERFGADDFCKHDILLVSGFQTENDAMRGEESLLLGCDLKDDALLIFPGTHSKHIVVQNELVIDVKTYMTGEFFELFSTKSLLAKSVAKNNIMHDEGFADGVREGVTNNILNASFHVRTNHLFQKISAEKNFHFLSGLLIGCELKELTTSHQKKVLLVCANNLLQQYKAALNIINQNRFEIKIVNADDALTKAHIKLYNMYKQFL